MTGLPISNMRKTSSSRASCFLPCRAHILVPGAFSTIISLRLYLESFSKTLRMSISPKESCWEFPRSLCISSSHRDSGDGAGPIYLLTLTAMLYIDFFRNYTFRLLSENVAIFLLPLCFLSIIASYRSKSALQALMAGILLGFAVLSRPNLILFAVLCIVIYLFYVVKNRHGSVLQPLLYSIAFLATFSLLILRDFAMTSQISIATITAGDAERPNLVALVQRVLFSLGFTRAMGDQEFQAIRPHWVVLWVLLTLYLIVRLRLDHQWEFRDALLILFLRCYLVRLLAVAPLNNYGFRMIVPVMPVVLFFGVKAFALLLQRLPAKL